MVYIPPMQMLDSVSNYRTQLMLPQWVGNETYSQFFKWCAKMGRHIILDNGANEGVETDNMRLVTIADTYGVQELVLPDTMGDFRETLDKAHLFLKHFKDGVPKWTKFGFVLHGYDARNAVDNFVTLQKVKSVFSLIDVIYIPRMLVTSRNLSARLQVAADIERLSRPTERKRIHLLGAAPENMMEVRHAQQMLLPIRSMDTSAPFVYGLRNKLVDEGVVHREHATYFHGLVSPAARELSLKNMLLMNSWAQGK